MPDNEEVNLELTEEEVKEEEGKEEEANEDEATEVINEEENTED